MRDRTFSLGSLLLLALSCLLGTLCVAQTPTRSAESSTIAGQNSAVHRKSYPPGQVEAGRTLFRQNCSFCHGRDATGGETGPDLTRSRLVTEDADGEKIVPIIRAGRPERGMPPFDLPADQISDLVAFIHTRQNNAVAAAGRGGNGGRKGVDPSDLQTGNAEAGKQYFNGAGGCSTCHSPTGDLAKLASRYQGLELEEQMIGLTDSAGLYHSWRTRDVHFTIDASVNAHVEQFSKYTDADIHNLMAYLQTLR
jgi:cytochrome c oxidase cbb3-type subunit III